MNTPTANPRNRLLPYQRRWADDESRWKFGLMSRQTGKDFCSAEEGVRDCYLHEQAEVCQSSKNGEISLAFATRFLKSPKKDALTLMLLAPKVLQEKTSACAEQSFPRLRLLWLAALFIGVAGARRRP